MSETHQVDVLVVGGGPTGMTVAGDLARAGRSVTVLERWPDVNPSSRAFATMARTLEVLDARGLADDLLAAGATTSAVNLFANVRLDLTSLPSRFPYALVTPQTNVDQALAGYASEQGATILRGVEVTGLTQDSAGVTLTARAKDDESSSSQWRARYVVGADGAHSTIRDLVSMPFPGKVVLSSVVLADVLLSDGPQGRGLTLGDTRDGLAFLAPYGRHDADGSWFRSMTWDRAHQVPDTEPVGEAEIGSVLNRSMGRDVGVVEVGWHSRFHCEERQVPDYRRGRVFLAGDSAHVHSPMGGQGMNTGIQDAANLGWKLDAVLGGAPDSVLDTYHAERHPIGRRVVRQSGLLMRAVTLGPPPARWLRNHIAPLVTARPRLNRAIAGSFAGTGLRYGHRRGEHELVGARATQIPLVGPRLTALQRGGSWVLVAERGGHAHGAAPWCAERTDDGPAVLVRPDGYIAWAGHAVASDGWRPALARWTGTAQVVGAEDTVPST